MRKQIVGLFGAASIASAALVAAVSLGGDGSSAAPVAAAGQVSAQADGQVSIQASKMGGKISRQEIISRADYWWQHRGTIVYGSGHSYRDKDNSKHRYRADCSGYVSMALHLKSSQNTVTLPKYGVKISRKNMKKGDFTGILGSGTIGRGGHVRIFDKWANKAHTAYVAYDFGSTPVKHQTYYLKNDKPRNGHGWTAYRYKHVV
jgi:hypothetical protein